MKNNKWKELSGGNRFSTTGEERVNADLKNRSDVRELAFTVLTFDKTEEWIREQIDSMDLEQRGEVILLLTKEFKDQLKKAGEILIDVLNNRDRG